MIRSVGDLVSRRDLVTAPTVDGDKKCFMRSVPEDLEEHVLHVGEVGGLDVGGAAKTTHG